MSKSGIRTSEFWLSVVVLAYDLLLAGGIIPHKDEVSAAISAVAAALVAFGYTWARAFVKAQARWLPTVTLDTSHYREIEEQITRGRTAKDMLRDALDEYFKEE